MEKRGEQKRREISGEERRTEEKINEWRKKRKEQ